MDKNNLLKISDAILQHLLQFRSENPGFTFSLRSRDSSQSGEKRLTQGQWFQGSSYVYVPLFKAGDDNRKIKTLGFVISFDKEGNLERNYLEISFKDTLRGKHDPGYVKFHFDLASKLDIKLSSNRHGTKRYPNAKDYLQNLNDYLTRVRLVALELIEQHGLQDSFIVDEREFKRNLNRIMKIKSKLSQNEEENLEPEQETKLKTNPLNQISYGPPGTGKTYSMVVEALAIIEEKGKHELQNEPYHILKSRYDDLVRKGQIAFTTFHQNMSYEDFVEGIKPLEPKEEGDPISYKVIPGIFKRISEEATENLNYIGTKEHSSLEPSFELAFAKLNREVTEAQFADTIKIKEKEVTGLRINLQSSYFIIPKIDGYSIKMINSEGKSNNSMTRETLRKIYENTDQIEDLISGGMRGYYLALVKQMKSWKFDINEDAKKVERKNFVLIIDEINRGNISSIFGELITLLEETKRAGKPEAIEITLPYSKEPFSVPSNLYVIGTMNTADRSVEALDTALRRRFSFSEMSPVYDLEGLQYDFANTTGAAILKTINRRIEKLLDKDHLIGHSYFLKKPNEDAKKKLMDSFYRNIIPLLQEYFYGDPEKIGAILGEGFIYQDLKQEDLVFASGYEDGDYMEHDVYVVIDYRVDEPVDAGNHIDMTFENAIKLLMNKSID